MAQVPRQKELFAQSVQAKIEVSPDHELLRLERALDWARTFLTRPNPAIGRNGGMRLLARMTGQTTRHAALNAHPPQVALSRKNNGIAMNGGEAIVTVQRHVRISPRGPRQQKAGPENQAQNAGASAGKVRQRNGLCAPMPSVTYIGSETHPCSKTTTRRKTIKQNP